MKVTDELRKVLSASPEGVALLEEMERLESGVAKSKADRKTAIKKTKATPSTKFYESEEVCLTCGSRHILVLASMDGANFSVVDDDTLLAKGHTLQRVPKEVTFKRKYCVECLNDLDDTPRGNLVWLVENLLPLVSGDKTAALIETLQKGLGYDTEFRKAESLKRRAERERQWDGDPNRDVPENGLRSSKASRQTSG